jgi:hypothetical protein
MIRIYYPVTSKVDFAVLGAWMVENGASQIVHYEDGFFYFADEDEELVIMFRLKFGI